MAQIIKRKYYMTDLKSSPELLPYGLRNYILQQARSMRVSGTIRRSFTEDLDQHIVACFYGAEEDLQILEDTILAQTTYWIYQRDLSTPDQHFQTFPFTDIRVLDSTGDVKPGANSQEWADKDAPRQLSQPRSQSENSSLKSAGGGVRAVKMLKSRSTANVTASFAPKTIDNSDDLWRLLHDPEVAQPDTDLPAVLKKLGVFSAKNVKYISETGVKEIALVLRDAQSTEFQELMNDMKAQSARL